MGWEDHLAVICARQGKTLNKALERLKRLLDVLEMESECGLAFARTQRWGYVTASPARLGAALRASESQTGVLVDGGDARAASTGTASAGSARRGCRVHVAYHGCHQGAGVLNTTFVEHAGYNRHAEANALLVIYPQARRTPLNPKGCWDWWGYTGKQYASNLGVQLLAVRRMVRAVAAALEQ